MLLTSFYIDKMLQILTTLRKIKDNRQEPEASSRNILLNTILFPKNLNYLTQRLPKANYTPLRARIGNNKFIHTVAGRNLKHKDDSLEDLIDRGSESFDHSDFRKGQIRNNSHNEKPRLNPIKPMDGYSDKYTIGIENEISKIKKQLEARRLKDEEDRKKLDLLLRERELREREVNNHKDISIDYKSHNISYDQPSSRMRADLLPEGYVMSRKRSQDPDIPERNISNISPIYHVRPSGRVHNENSPFRNNSRGREAKNRIGLHALALGMREKVGEEFHIPDIADLPKPRLSKLPPVNRQQCKNQFLEGRNLSPSLNRMLSHDATPIIYLKQKLNEIARLQGDDFGGKGGIDSMIRPQADVVIQ